jgi:hypothetical protein
MIRGETFQWISDEFGISIGVAKIMGFKKLSDEKEELGETRFKQWDGELTINEIITSAIESDTYQPLQRELYRLKSKGSRAKELTIYKKAWRDIRNGK